MRRRSRGRRAAWVLGSTSRTRKPSAAPSPSGEHHRRRERPPVRIGRGKPLSPTRARAGRRARPRTGTRLPVLADGDGVLANRDPPAIFDKPLPSAEAISNVDNMLAFPHVQTAGEQPRFWQAFTTVAADVDARGNLVPDTHLVALMMRTACGRSGPTTATTGASTESRSETRSPERMRGQRWENGGDRPLAGSVPELIDPVRDLPPTFYEGLPLEGGAGLCPAGAQARSCYAERRRNAMKKGLPGGRLRVVH